MTSNAFGLAQLGSAYADGALGSRNKVINGAMVIDQRNAGASVTLGASALFPVDRWKAHEDTDGAATAQQVSDAPAGFATSLKITVTGTDASLTGLQYFDVRQQIEGYNIADLSFGTAAAKDVTVSFWVKSSVTGTYGGGISNGAFNRSYPFTYAISAADTWEYKTITVSGDTSGTWTTTNATGMYLFFNLGSGPDYAGTPGQWNAAGDLAATGTTNLIATSGATFYITGVQLEAGDVATPFEHRSYGQELALCKRYFQKYAEYHAVASGGQRVPITTFPVEMRATPSITSAAIDNIENGATLIATPTYTSNLAAGAGWSQQLTGVAGVFARIRDLTLSAEL